MKRHRMPEMKEGGVNVTPLIDVVMCLIIFFMLVAKIGVDTGADKNIDVPPGFYGTSIADMGNTITLNVVNGPSGVFDSAGVQAPLITALVGSRMADLKLHDNSTGKMMFPLRDTLMYFREGDPANNVKPNPDFKVIVRGDKTLTWNFLAPVLVEITAAHVKTYAFATSPGQKPGVDASTVAPAGE